MESTLLQRWQKVTQQIQKACTDSAQDSVTLLAGTKTKPTEMSTE